MKKRYEVRVSDDLLFVGVFDLQENEYVVNECVKFLDYVMLLDTAELICDLCNKVDEQTARIEELKKEIKQ